MSATPRFISDLHLGHKKILGFAGEHREGSSTDEHDEWIVSRWNETVGKRDPVFILGDLAFSRAGLERVKSLRGQKFLLLGNHDRFSLPDYEAVGLKIFGFCKYKGFWLSHAPIHPLELRGKPNIHGHVHHNSLPDFRYYNVSVEALAGRPVSLDQIRQFYEKNPIALPS